MAKEGLHFIDEGLGDKLKAAVTQYGKGDMSPEQLLAKLKELLPVHKTDRDTWKARVEGFHLISQDLIDRIVATNGKIDGKTFTAESVVKQARLRPLSYYHYVTGSREPAANVRTEDDLFNDPTTSLVKLEDDIIALAKLIRKV